MYFPRTIKCSPLDTATQSRDVSRDCDALAAPQHGATHGLCRSSLLHSVFPHSPVVSFTQYQIFLRASCSTYWGITLGLPDQMLRTSVSVSGGHRKTVNILRWRGITYFYVSTHACTLIQTCCLDLPPCFFSAPLSFQTSQVKLVNTFSRVKKKTRLKGGEAQTPEVTRQKIWLRLLFSPGDPITSVAKVPGEKKRITAEILCVNLFYLIIRWIWVWPTLPQ